MRCIWLQLHHIRRVSLKSANDLYIFCKLFSCRDVASVVSLPILHGIDDLGTDTTYRSHVLESSDPNSHFVVLSRVEFPLATENLMMRL